ncbi:protein disulfide-isomerase 5-3 [Gossypium australe]|uniref:Protein disulfide-isomerase 5-3 n=1 Tax=Gossypium australe TaxID=47621 RepID=A0A5B6WTR8_9ROSI|nr:protein disulfide-isomerase 5-3 [Gossypium australe]
MINGCESEKFKPTRGLRQGDLLSPYIFLYAGSDGKGSHLLFVDDSILFGEASDQGVQTLKNILHEYEEASFDDEAVEGSVSLNSDSFAKLSQEHPVLVVNFFAPWCYWSTRLAVMMEANKRLRKTRITLVIIL